MIDTKDVSSNRYLTYLIIIILLIFVNKYIYNKIAI